MTQSFGIDVATIDDASIEAGLDALATPPDWLVAIEDLTRLRADLERTIPELASGELHLAACKFKRAHIEGGTYTALCRLKIEDRDGGSKHDVDVHGVLVLPWMDPPAADGTPSGDFEALNWHTYLPDLRWEISMEPTDTALPAMPTLTDPDLSRTLLEAAIRATGGGLVDIEIARCTPTVMRYREGRRCTIRYELEYAADRRQPDWPDGLIAKVYEGDEGRATFEAMTALWASPLRESSTVKIAEPLGFIPEQSVMVQGLVPGDLPLKKHIKKVFKDGLDAGIAALESPVRKAGRGLGEMHTSGALVGQVVTWEEQVAAVRHAGDELAGVVPTLADAMEPLVSRLEALAEVEPAGPLVPTHRSFRPAQILLDGDDIAFIDFDGFCQAEAGLDLALFRTTLCDLILRALEVDDQPMSVEEQAACQVKLDELCAIFLAGYEEVAEYSPGRLALWDTLTSAKDILDCWRKIKFEHLERRMRILHHKIGDVPPVS